MTPEEKDSTDLFLRSSISIIKMFLDASAHKTVLARRRAPPAGVSRAPSEIPAQISRHHEVSHVGDNRPSVLMVGFFRHV